MRALAVLLVFVWHFTHRGDGFPVPFEGAPQLFILAIFDEGHTGVALFMTLSGYLFAKLLNGKEVDYPSFFWNRFIRLAPLLVVIMLIVGIVRFVQGADMPAYAISLIRGFWWNAWPNGGWSITVELHFYILLPFLLWFFRKSPITLVLLLLVAIALRAAIFQERGEIQSLSYWRIVGRIDQFLLGILFFHYRALVVKRHLLVIASLMAFLFFYAYFDRLGGFYQFPSYPSPSPLWIILPTLEGLAYGLLIGYYDNSFSPPNHGFSGFIGRIGAYSYSIYLFHFFYVFSAAAFVHQYVVDISNFYLAFLVALICFLPMIPVGYLSFRYIESPFLKLRRRYIVEPKSNAVEAGAQTVG